MYREIELAREARQNPSHGSSMFVVDDSTDVHNSDVSGNTEAPETITDPEILEILGKNPSSDNTKDSVLHPDIATRWQHWIARGISKSEKSDLLAEYGRGGNCHLEAPVLNPEVGASLNEASRKRDGYYVEAQNNIGSSLAALGSGITLILKSPVDAINKKELLKYLLVTGKLLASLHHQQTSARKALILPSVEKKANWYWRRPKLTPSYLERISRTCYNQLRPWKNWGRT